MNQVFVIWFVCFALNPLSVGGECFGQPEKEFFTECGEQYFDCESCVIGTLLYTSCNGWCPQTGICAGGGDAPIACADGEVAYKDFCPGDSSNPAFGNKECIIVSYEWYFCTQIVNGVGSCDANYVSNYCEVRDQVSSQLCNGNSIEVENPDYPFGGWDLGYFKKNPAGVLVKFGPGQGLYTSGCYRFDYDPVSEGYMCADGDSYALKYSLALDGQPVAPSSPVNSPIALPPSAPQPTPPNSSARGTGLRNVKKVVIFFLVWFM